MILVLMSIIAFYVGDITRKYVYNLLCAVKRSGLMINDVHKCTILIYKAYLRMVYMDEELLKENVMI